LWHKVFLWTFPNYVIGAGVAAITSAFGTTSVWITGAALVAVLFAVYKSYQTYAAHSTEVQPKPMAMAAGK
jgi:energy-converting hydrogenase Eha subunit A